MLLLQDDDHELLWTSPLRLLQAVDVMLARWSASGSEAALLVGQSSAGVDTFACLQELRQDVVEYL